MNEAVNNECKPELDLTILKGYLESLRRQAESRSDCPGMKSSLGLIARELDEVNISKTRMNEIVAELSLYERLLRERLEREQREKENYDTSFDKIGKTFSGEMQV